MVRSNFSSDRVVESPFLSLRQSSIISLLPACVSMGSMKKGILTETKLNR